MCTFVWPHALDLSAPEQFTASVKHHHTLHHHTLPATHHTPQQLAVLILIIHTHLPPNICLILCARHHSDVRGCCVGCEALMWGLWCSTWGYGPVAATTDTDAPSVCGLEAGASVIWLANESATAALHSPLTWPSCFSCRSATLSSSVVKLAIACGSEREGERGHSCGAGLRGCWASYGVVGSLQRGPPSRTVPRWSSCWSLSSSCPCIRLLHGSSATRGSTLAATAPNAALDPPVAAAAAAAAVLLL